MSESLPSSAKEHVDRLTIRRLMLLTAGVAVGLTIFSPPLKEMNPGSADDWRVLWNALAVGLAAPAPLFCTAVGFRNGRLGFGGMFALAAGLGVWLLLPPAIIEWLGRNASPRVDIDQAVFCLFFVLPSMGLWYLLAAFVGGQVGRRLFSRSTPWTDKYGFFLALLWSPLGAWQLVEIYRNVLK
jgi:hypothetical protein